MTQFRHHLLRIMIRLCNCTIFIIILISGSLFAQSIPYNDNNQIDSLFIAGKNYFGEGDFFNAISNCKRVVNLEPRSEASSECMEIIIFSYIKLDDSKEACRSYRLSKNHFIEMKNLPLLRKNLQQYLLQKNLSFIKTIDLGIHETWFGRKKTRNHIYHAEAIQRILNSNTSADFEKSFQILLNDFMNSEIYSCGQSLFDFWDEYLIKKCIKNNLKMGQRRANIERYRVKQSERHLDWYHDHIISVHVFQDVSTEFNIPSCLNK